MKAIWSATDRGYIDEIISALKVLGKEKIICYADEINWLKQLRKRTEEDYKQHYRIQAAIAAMQAELTNPNNVFSMCDDKLAIITKRAVRYADALVEGLEKGGQDE